MPPCDVPVNEDNGLSRVLRPWHYRAGGGAEGGCSRQQGGVLIACDVLVKKSEPAGKLLLCK